MTHYGMAIDLARCIGCHTCATACKMANNLPKNVHFNRVRTVGGDSMDTAAGEYGANTMSFLPVQCQHCENPACLDVCPTGATTKDEETGIVSVDSSRASDASRASRLARTKGRNAHQRNEYYLSGEVAVGESTRRRTRAARWRKCAFCKNSHRPRRGAGMKLCPGRARYWGDSTIPSRPCRRPSRAARRCSFRRKPARSRVYTTCSNKTRHEAGRRFTATAVPLLRRIAGTRGTHGARRSSEAGGGKGRRVRVAVVPVRLP